MQPIASRRSKPRRIAPTKAGFTLVEIMIVVAIVGLLAAIAVPGFVRARKRTQATTILGELRLIDSAMDQYALEYNKKTGDTVTVAAWKTYLKPESRLYTTGMDIFGASYGDQTLGILPPVPATSFDALTPVTDSAFWAPYVKGP